MPQLSYTYKGKTYTMKPVTKEALVKLIEETPLPMGSQSSPKTKRDKDVPSKLELYRQSLA